MSDMAGHAAGAGLGHQLETQALEPRRMSEDKGATGERERASEQPRMYSIAPRKKSPLND